MARRVCGAELPAQGIPCVLVAARVGGVQDLVNLGDTPELVVFVCLPVGASAVRGGCADQCTMLGMPMQ